MGASLLAVAKYIYYDVGGKLNKGGSLLLFLLLFANRMRVFRSDILKTRFWFNVLAVYLVKKKLNQRTNYEMSNYLCASEILIVSK